MAPLAQNFCFIMNYNCAKFHASITMCMIKLRICPTMKLACYNVEVFVLMILSEM